ncbi:MAG: ArsR family transcriptional regulator [Nitrospira bacterium HGW-Nitrospira-1]|nr:MAG: ArsR family transcriptional regulator [Nitrospira bacterium HGW-Nitrospira-1]
MEVLLNIFKALSDETRLRILKLLENGELCVCDIVAAMEMSQPKVSFHLNVLKEAGFLKDRKQGRWIHYRLDESDMFRRFLLLSTLEKIPKEAVTKDKERLHAFLQGKTSKDNVLSLPDKKRCAGRCK